MWASRGPDKTPTSVSASYGVRAEGYCVDYGRIFVKYDVGKFWENIGKSHQMSCNYESFIITNIHLGVYTKEITCLCSAQVRILEISYTRVKFLWPYASQKVNTGACVAQRLFVRNRN